MRYVWVLTLWIFAAVPLQVAAQEKGQPKSGNAALERELFAIELKWMKAEFDKKMDGPDSMANCGRMTSSTSCQEGVWSISKK